MKRFETQLKSFLSSLDKNKKFTPREMIEKINYIRGNGVDDVSLLEKSLKNTKFIKEVLRMYKHSRNHQVVVYRKKNEVRVMTIERWNAVHDTLRRAHIGLRKYWDKQNQR